MPTIDSALDLARARGEIGVQVAAYLQGTPIVDAWTGPVDGDTIFPCFSVAKSVTATALHLQAERGLVDYDAPIATYWPEFAVNGKERATVAHALAHRLGIPHMPPETTPERLDDWDWLVERIAALTPLHEPGTVNAYSPMTFGWVVGEIVRRTDPQRRPFGRFVQEELCTPLGIDSLWLGVPPSQLHRGAQLQQGPTGDTSPEAAAFRATVVPAAVAIGAEVYNRDVVRRACIPATGLVANARSLARLFAMLANGGELDGVRLLSPERVRSFAQPRDGYDEDDRVYFRPMPVGAMGFWLADPAAGSGAGLICGVGAGGSVAWADLDSGLAGAICHNRMFAGTPLDEHPFVPLGDAVRAVARDGAR